MGKSLKTPKQMERHLKGIANHHRIAILLLVEKLPGITLDGIVEALDANEKTIGEHARRLAAAGLLNKKYVGNRVSHTLSPYGKICVRFLNTFRKQ